MSATLGASEDFYKDENGVIRNTEAFCAKQRELDKQNAERIASCFANTDELNSLFKNSGNEFLSYCLCSFRSPTLAMGDHSCNRDENMYPHYRLVRINGIHPKQCHSFGPSSLFTLINEDPVSGTPANNLPVSVVPIIDGGIGERGSEVYYKNQIIGYTIGLQFRGACMKYTDNLDANDNQLGEKCHLISTEKEFSIY